MLNYLDDWRIVQGSLSIERILSLPDSKEKHHLIEIREMLVHENYVPNECCVSENPINGVYIISTLIQGKYEFLCDIQEREGKLTPCYTLEKTNEFGINNFPCRSIKESFEKTEC